MPDDRVLGGKRTLNFILEEPTDLRFIEATMALHNYGGEWLVRNAGKKNTGGGVVLPDAELEEFILSGSCVRL